MTARKQQGSLKARRTAARLAAVQVLYQMRLNNQPARVALREFGQDRVGVPVDGDTFVTPDAETLDAVIEGADARADDIDAIVTRALRDGGRDRIETLLDCILRAGVAELLCRPDVDTGVIINDYLSVTSGFYEGGESKIVNAVLDKAAKAVR